MDHEPDHSIYSLVRNDDGERQPRDTVEGEDIQRLRMLNVFAPCTLQIGDKNLYTMQENDVVMMREDWRKLERQSLNLAGSKVKKDKAEIPESRLDLSVSLQRAWELFHTKEKRN